MKIFFFLLASTLLLPMSAQAKSPAGKKPGGEIKVMTRNVYLGADLAPGLEAASLAQLSEGAGEIYRSVGTTNPSLRMKAIAREIRSNNPDLVALQEVALWREITPPNVYLPTGDPPISEKVRFDFLDLILKNLNRKQAKKNRYRVLALTKEFDFEAPTDVDGNTATCYAGNWSGALGEGNGCGTFPGADLTARLTMRDVILGKASASATMYKNFSDDSLYQAKLAGGINVPITRGWNAVDVSIRKSPTVRFINTHLEAFADPEGPRCAQAREVYREAIAPSPHPVILAGDLNSDDLSVDGDATNPGLEGVGYERCAYLALQNLDMKSLTQRNATCCFASALLDSKIPGENRIDHLLSNSSRIRPIGKTIISGRREISAKAPLLASDHLGVIQKVRLK